MFPELLEPRKALVRTFGLSDIIKTFFLNLGFTFQLRCSCPSTGNCMLCVSCVKEMWVL